MIAEGKGKRIYATDNPDEAVVYYKDEAIAFRGLKIGRIIGKGEINNLLCEYLFTLLQQKGVPNHFLHRINDRSMLVLKVDIIPVVIKVRNIVAGSLAQRIGYPEGARLKNTVIEYCLKDRNLDDPLVNLTHVTAMGLATAQELPYDGRDRCKGQPHTHGYSKRHQHRTDRFQTRIRAVPWGCFIV